MARNPHTADDLDALACELESASKDIRAIAKHLRESGMPHSLIHGSTIKTVYIPELLDWIGKTKADTESQVRSYLIGNQSKAELHKKQTENRKLAAAKKPFKAKAARKKAE